MEKDAMRVPLGFLSRSTRLSTHATPWPYLRRFMPRRLVSIGLGDPATAALYWPGPEVVLVAASCGDYAVLARPGGWAIAAVGSGAKMGYLSRCRRAQPLLLQKASRCNKISRHAARLPYGVDYV